MYLKKTLIKLTVKLSTRVYFKIFTNEEVDNYKFEEVVTSINTMTLSQKIRNTFHL